LRYLNEDLKERAKGSFVSISKSLLIFLVQFIIVAVIP
jgi:hypothetical protein